MKNSFIRIFVEDNPISVKTEKLNFMDAIEQKLNDLPYNVSVTENGAIGYRTTGSALVDINYMTSSLRKKKDNELFDMFQAAYYENPIFAWKWLFFLRDIRGGMGERDTFKRIIKHMADFRPKETAI